MRDKDIYHRVQVGVSFYYGSLRHGYREEVGEEVVETSDGLGLRQLRLRTLLGDVLFPSVPGLQDQQSKPIESKSELSSFIDELASEALSVVATNFFRLVLFAPISALEVIVKYMDRIMAEVYHWQFNRQQR